MFVFMNAARIGAGQQGVVHAELAYQNALAYCRERRASRAPGGDSCAAPHPLVLHPDVRRMLLEQRAIAEGGRALILESACLLDQAECGDDQDAREAAKERLALLTPIIKGFLTELGVEAANLALQCLGGHGYVREWGLEQNLRDSRIATLYEGTTGIQALDLLGRKVVRDKGRTLQRLRQAIERHCAAASRHGPLAAYATQLSDELIQWGLLTEQLIENGERDPFAVPAAASDYLMYSGYLVMADVWLRSALVAHRALGSGLQDQHYRQKMVTSGFFFERMLPRCLGLRAVIVSGPSTLLAEGDRALTLEVDTEGVATDERGANTLGASAE
jgi:hypothetical protein